MAFRQRLSVWFMRTLCLLLALFIFGNHLALAETTKEYEVHDYGFYSADRGGGCKAATNTLTGNGNEEQVYNYFLSKGLTATAVAGLVGNFSVESGFDPTAYNPGTHTDNPSPAHAFGLVQWLGGRQTALRQAADDAGKPITDLGVQLDFSWQELSTSYKDKVLDPLQQSTDLARAVNIVNTYYEGSGESDAPRLQAAQDALALYGSNTPSGTITGATPAAGGGSCVQASAGQYLNPFRDVPNITQAGIDAGVDYAGDGPVHPIGNATITDANPHSHWVGGNAVSYKLSDGPAAGKVMYVTENCTVEAGLQVGQTVTPNDTICTMHNTYPYIETGWAADRQNSSTPLAYVDNCYYIVNPSIGQKTSTAYGVNTDELMQKLGVPKASQLGGPVTCTLPGDWPSWQ